MPLLGEHGPQTNVGLLLVTGDRGLAGGFNSQIVRAGVRAVAELTEEGLRSNWYATGRRGVSSLSFRGYELTAATPASPTDPPTRTRVRSPTI